jgi:hypothetical protein
VVFSFQNLKLTFESLLEEIQQIFREAKAIQLCLAILQEIEQLVDIQTIEFATEILRTLAVRNGNCTTFKISFIEYFYKTKLTLEISSKKSNAYHYEWRNSYIDFLVKKCRGA